MTIGKKNPVCEQSSHLSPSIESHGHMISIPALVINRIHGKGGNKIIRRDQMIFHLAIALLCLTIKGEIRSLICCGEVIFHSVTLALSQVAGPSCGHSIFLPPHSKKKSFEESFVNCQ